MFEQVINYQYQKTLENEKDPNFLKMVKERGTKTLISKQTKEHLLQLDFEPGDEVVIQTYLRQISFFETIKNKYNNRMKIHDFITAYVSSQEPHQHGEGKAKAEQQSLLQDNQ